jgi:acyl-CoA synthetase (AMP-forming)/AMP-acid ligase II
MLQVIEARNEPLTELGLTQTCPTGTVGEIIARGSTVTRSYDQLPEATERAKIKDGEYFWHRMGDLGYFDAAGRLWFCGRQAEQVETPEGALYPDCCEAITNQHSRVFRSALINFGGKPALVIEPEPGEFPEDPAARLAFETELRSLCEEQAMTARIDTFFFQKKFPVDVRHNAKIHRLSLSREWSKKELQS